MGGIASGPQRVYSTVPSVDPNGQVVYQQSNVDVPGAGRGNFSLSLTVTQLLYDGGRWWNQIALAGAQAEAAEGQLDEQRLVSQFEAERRFFELVKAQVTQDVLQASLSRSQAQLERARSMFIAGRAGRLEALDAEINVGNDRIGLLRQRQALTAAQVDLLKWLGRPSSPVEAVDPNVPVDQQAQPNSAEANAAARQQRPLLKALAAQVRGSERAVEVAWAPYLPRVAASAAYSRASVSADPFFTDLSKQNAVSGGLQLQWDLFSGLQTRAQVAQAELSVSAANASLAQAAADLEGDVRQALETLSVQLQVAGIAAGNLTLARSAMALAEERFSAGAGSTLEVRDAQVKLTTAALNEVTARLDVEIARAGLRRVVGGEVAQSAPRGAP